VCADYKTSIHINPATYEELFYINQKLSTLIIVEEEEERKNKQHTHAAMRPRFWRTTRHAVREKRSTSAETTEETVFTRLTLRYNDRPDAHKAEIYTLQHTQEIDTPASVYIYYKCAFSITPPKSFHYHYQFF